MTQWSIVVITVINNILLVRYGSVSVFGPDIPLAAFVVIMKLFQIVLNIGISESGSPQARSQSSDTTMGRGSMIVYGSC